MPFESGILYGAHAHHPHSQHIARALHEGYILERFMCCGVDHYNTQFARWVRKGIEWTIPPFDTRLKRRRIDGAIPDDRIMTEWGWEVPLAVVSKLGLSSRLADWIWERSEHRFDKNLAAILKEESFGGFFGIEHGALRALRASRDIGLPGLLGFFSPHHKALSEWVFSEYQRFPSLLTPYRKHVMNQAGRRNQRKDREAELADFIHVPSTFIEKTLVEAGVEEDKIYVAPIGCPPPSESNSADGPETPRVVFAGNLYVRKGVHYLLRAWDQLSPTSGQELHLFGDLTFPPQDEDMDSSVKVRGCVPQDKLFDEFQKASILVLPTLLDGYGMVVSEALAHGLPVITTTNAGAADLIDEGENGFVVKPRDSEALAERLEWIFNNPAKVDRMGECARDTASSWQWEDFRLRLRSQISEAFGFSLCEDRLNESSQ